MAREGIEAEKQFKASFRLALYLAARTTLRWETDQTMHLLIMVLRWLAGFLPGGMQPAFAEPIRTWVGAASGPVRAGFFLSDVSRVGWIKVRPVLEEIVGSPCWHPVLAGMLRRDGGLGGPYLTRSDRLVRQRVLAPDGWTARSSPVHPLRS